MSIRHYLFLLFGGLILLLGLSQLLIGEALKRQLESDLSEDSVALSRQLVDIVVEDLDENLRFVTKAPEVAAIPEEAELALTIEDIRRHVPSEAQLIEMHQHELEQIGRAHV